MSIAEKKQLVINQAKKDNAEIFVEDILADEFTFDKTVEYILKGERVGWGGMHLLSITD